MTPSDLNRSIRERNKPLFAKAEALSARLGSAIVLDTCHKPRLISLRAGLRSKIACNHPRMLRTWIGEFEDAIDMECRSARAQYERAALSGVVEMGEAA